MQMTNISAVAALAIATVMIAPSGAREPDAGGRNIDPRRRDG